MNYKKRAVNIVLIIAIMFTMLGSNVVVKAGVEITPPSVNAKAYVMMDANSGEILFEKNSNSKIYPASTVKLMTAVVAVENAKLSKRITTKSSVLNGIASDASKLNMKAGVTYSLEQWLNMLLIYSAADAADTIAYGVSGSVSKFVKLMNNKAKELGMSQTKFDNTIGLDIGNNFNNMYSTAEDMAILARYAMSNKTIRNIVNKAYYKIPATTNNAERTIKNTNHFVNSNTYKSDIFTIIGTKTGSTKAAGKVLIATAEDEFGHELICAFFGASNRTQMYNDIYDLFDYTFSGFDYGYFDLTTSFYDTRMLLYSDVFAKYYEEGVLKGDGKRGFSPKTNATQRVFTSLVNNIANVAFTTENPNAATTAVDLAEMIFSVIPYSYSESTYQRIISKLKNIDGLTKTQRSYLVALYQEYILPDDYGYDVRKKFTKADAVIIGDIFKDYLLYMQ